LAKKKETTFKDRIYPILKALPNTWVEKIQQRSIRGTPDFLMCVNGMFVGLELKKSDKEDEDLLQDHKLNLINKAGGLGLKASPENWNKILLTLTALSRGETNDRNYSGTA